MPGLAMASLPALGTTAVVLTLASELIPAVHEVEREVEAIDRTCSRFREDSDLTRLNRAGGAWTTVDPLLVEAVHTAIRAAETTDGLVDPTVGLAILRSGYDRDFSQVASEGPALRSAPLRLVVEGWRHIALRPATQQIRIPRGVRLDLGSTAKALAADRAAARAAAATRSGVLVSLGGDIATAGAAPPGGWLVGIADDHAARALPGESVTIAAGGLATSSTSVRRWSRGGVPLHHIIDPRTGEPAPEVWRTVSVCGTTCVDANTASTAAIVLGEAAPAWLEDRGLPARLARPDGTVVRVTGWPERMSA